MRDFLRNVAASLMVLGMAIAMLIAITGFALADEDTGFSAKNTPAPAISSAVKVCISLDCKTGHGSGVHIGNGYFLTAGHVADAQTSPDWILKGEDGRIIRAKAVWVMSTADLALLHVDLDKTTLKFVFPSSPPACRDPVPEEDVLAIGNPADFPFAHVKGYITAGPMKEIGHWKDAYALILPAVGGFSGGPVYDSRGNVLALVVGGMANGSPYTIIEPVRKVCGLLPDLGSK